MKKIAFVAAILFLGCTSTDGNSYLSSLLDFPAPIGAAGVGMYNGELYVFGGSNDYSGDSNYAFIYKFDGMHWQTVDTMINANTWDGKLIIDGENAYYVNGWPGWDGSLQRYNLTTHTWTILDTGNVEQNWGTTAQLIGNKIYHFGTGGEVDIYDIGTGTWTPGNSNDSITTFSNTLMSASYNNDIFITGYGDSMLYKYSITNNAFTVESQMPRIIGAGALVQLDGTLYFVGGGSDYTAEYADIYKYDIDDQKWSLSSAMLPAPLAFPGYVLDDDRLILVGGFDINDDGTTAVVKIDLD